MAEKHFPPAGQSLIGSGHTTTASCPCDPVRVVITKRNSRGRTGQQGYTVVRVEYRHNAIEAAA